jgi:hypothetical protein
MEEFQMSAARNGVEQGREKRAGEKEVVKEAGERGWSCVLPVTCAFQLRELRSPPSAAVTSSTRNDAMSNYTDWLLFVMTDAFTLN